MTAEGLIRQLDAPLASLLAESATVHVALFDRAGHISYANAALIETCGLDPVGRVWASLLSPASARALLTHIERGDPTGLLIRLAAAHGEPPTLRVFVRPVPSGFALVGEPPWAALRFQLAHLTSLLQAYQRGVGAPESQATEWRLKKLSEVLPMCVSCRSVKTGEHTWESAAEFLARSADFLSHGCCERCAERLEREGDPARR